MVGHQIDWRSPPCSPQQKSGNSGGIGSGVYPTSCTLPSRFCLCCPPPIYSPYTVEELKDIIATVILLDHVFIYKHLEIMDIELLGRKICDLFHLEDAEFGS